MRLPLDRRVLAFALLAGTPAVVVALWFIWTGPDGLLLRSGLSALILSPWLALAYAARRTLLRPLQVLANLLGGLRQGDFTLRARHAGSDDPLAIALLETNALGQALQQQRLGALEATALLRAVMAEIDVAVFAFDEDDRLQLANRAGERLLGQPAERLLGHTATHLGLAEARNAPPGRTFDASFPGGAGRWEVRRRAFRQGGLPVELLVLADVTRTLRAEERLAWQRLVRVLSHEISNSLAPIRSLSGTLVTLLDRPPTEDGRADMRRGLEVIGSRAEALGRFMAGYARLARLPEPDLADVDVGTWVRRVADLSQSPTVTVVGGPPAVIRGDADQLEQALINLVKNAVEAAGPEGQVEIEWGAGRDGVLEVEVRDNGPGLGSTTNLFVPFFTTKPGGTGIGLALSRQIAEAHGGDLSLGDRGEGPGCVARIRLPLPPRESPDR